MCVVVTIKHSTDREKEENQKISKRKWIEGMKLDVYEWLVRRKS